MRRLALLGAAVCALAWLTPTPAIGGWLWDLGNALGFVGLAAMLALNFESGHGRAHRALAWFAVAAVIVHGAWLLVLDDTVVEYLKVTMPGYMAAGLLAFAVLFLVVLVSARARHPAPGRQGSGSTPGDGHRYLLNAPRNHAPGLIGRPIMRATTIPGAVCHACIGLD